MERKKLDQLLAAIAEGDNTAFEELYRATAKGVYAFAYSYLNNREDAEDVMQKTFLQIKRKAGSYQKGTNARAWMLQMVKHLALDEWRRKQREVSRSVPLSETEAQCVGWKGRSSLEYLMQALSPAEREVVILHVIWGYKHREIAAFLQEPLGTITWRYRAAIKKLEQYREEP